MVSSFINADKMTSLNTRWLTTSALHDPWKRNTLGSMLEKASLDDLILFPLIALGSLYVLNRGSLWKRSEEFHPKLFERHQIGSLVEKPMKSRSIQQATEEIGARVVVLWGSQSGFAEALAHSLAQDIQQRFAVRPLLADLADYDAKSITRLPKSLPVIFIVSTYGEGDPPDNAREFFSWSRTAGGTCLKGSNLAAFGCGNSNYQNYNKVVDDLQAFLESAGATAIVSTGKGDEATRTTREDFMDWKDALVAALSHKLGFLEVEREYEPSLHVTESEPITGEDDSKIGAPFCQPTTREDKLQSQIIKLSIVSRKLLARYDEHNRSCVEVIADLSSYSNVKYKTGDHIAVWPENPAHDVEMVLQLLGLYEKKDTAIAISPRDGRTQPKLPTQTTIDALFRHYLDICGPVSRETVSALSRMASTSLVKENWSAITTSKENFLEHLTTNHLSFAQILRQSIALDTSASWESLSLSFVIDHVNPLAPRLYSISSSAMISPRQVSLTVANKPTVLVNNPSVTIPGLTSSFLTGPYRSDTLEHNLASAPTIYAQIRQTTFKLPVNPATPMILVAAGSGIAPFRAFIQERARLKSLRRDVGQTILFFGCQNQHDLLYQDEFNKFTKGPLAGIFRIIPAFSRAGPTKQYVQKMVETHATDVCDLLLEKDAAIYFCGSALMARQVNQTIRTQIMRGKGLDDNGFNDWRSHKKLTKRWFEDVWV